MKPFTSASPNDWKAHLESENGKIIDVRSADEFEDSFIEGAENIDVRGVNFDTNLDSLNRDQPYFVYCRSGARSKSAMDIMQSKGFKKVFNLEGGIMKWEFDGNNVEYGDEF